MLSKNNDINKQDIKKEPVISQNVSSEKPVEKKTKNTYNNRKYPGEIKIAPEVLAMIVNRKTINVPGVAGLVSHSKGGFGTLLGVKEIEEGIKVELKENQHISAFISIIVEYGYIIIDVAKKIQQEVKKELKNNTGLIVDSIDVNVMGISLSGQNTTINRYG